MILLKTVVLFVLANPAEFYPLVTEAEKNEICGICSRYLIKPIKGEPVVPTYPTYDVLELWSNNEVYKCGQDWSDWLDLKNNDISETKNTKIVNGVNALQNQFPWQVGLAFGYGSQIDCGGSIISSREILTAAHCVQSNIYKGAYHSANGYIPKESFPIRQCIYAVVGEHDKSNTNEGEQWNRICDVKVHTSYLGRINEYVYGRWYDNRYNEYDFAVLTLCTELKFTDKVAPVCLPQKNSEGKYDPYVNKDVRASGWGAVGTGQPLPTILQTVELQTLSNTDCFTSYMYPQSQDHLSKICAYGTNGQYNGKDTCQGDSGGPLVISNNNFCTLVGVTSYGTGCALFGFPGVYGRVTYAMEWIEQKINPDGSIGIQGSRGIQPAPPPAPGPACSTNSNIIELRKDSKNSRSLKNTGGVTYYYFEKDKKLSRKKAQETCISKYGGQLTSINTKDEYEWIKKQVIDLKMFGPIAIGGQWKDKSSRKFEWTDESEMDMSVLNANWFRTRNYQFPSYKNKKRINLELWYSRRALGFANALDHKAPTMYICKVADSCSA